MGRCPWGWQCENCCSQMGIGGFAGMGCVSRCSVRHGSAAGCSLPHLVACLGTRAVLLAPL